MSTRMQIENVSTTLNLIRYTYILLILNLNISMAMLHRVKEIPTFTPYAKPSATHHGPTQFCWMVDTTFDTRFTFHTPQSAQPYYVVQRKFAPDGLYPINIIKR